jgi:hypothetical protein
MGATARVGPRRLADGGRIPAVPDGHEVSRHPPRRNPDPSLGPGSSARPPSCDSFGRTLP